MKQDNLTQAYDSSLIAKNLSIILEVNNISCNKLAIILNIPPITLRRILDGLTIDPRISTLKLITEYFNIPVNYLTDNTDVNLLKNLNNSKLQIVPFVKWNNLINNELANVIKDTKVWKTISTNSGTILGKNTFATEVPVLSSSYFIGGTTLIIDPDAEIRDGDIVFVRVNKTRELILKKVNKNYPYVNLTSIIEDKSLPMVEYDENILKIEGVVLFTILEMR